MVSTALKPYPFEFVKRKSVWHDKGRVERQPVVIAGGGVAGLTLALALAVQGVRSVVLEADDSVCFGSRAICISRRSLEIFERLGIAGALLDKGLAWTSGRSFYRQQEVLHFSMPQDDDQHLPPMINIQQYYVEEFLVRALEKHAGLVDIRWSSRLIGLEQRSGSVVVEVEHEGRRHTLEGEWLAACDGGRSTVRDALGLSLRGTAYEGAYVIADIELETNLPTERLAWFDPPSNPGETILMHRQPDNIWRIDYQIGKDEDPEKAVLPENVLPRIQAHLEMIDETGKWAPLWISLYRANALALEHFRHERVFFVGDAAHLVPIFGVRGANSAIDDADNLAWKLAHVVGRGAGEELLDSYSSERAHAARENLQQGMKSTEFMAPPSNGFQLMRRAVLSLASKAPGVRPLINPRQTSAIRYAESSALAQHDDEELFRHGPQRGSVLQNLPLRLIDAKGRQSSIHLTQLLRPGEYLLLVFGNGHDAACEASRAVKELPAEWAVRLLFVCSSMLEPVAQEHVVDSGARMAALYDAEPGTAYLVRPDGYVFGRWRSLSASVLATALCSMSGGAVKEAWHD